MASVVKAVGETLGKVVGFAAGFVFDLAGDLLSGLLPKVAEIAADTSHQQLSTAPASRRTRIYGETVVSGPIVKYEKVTSGDKEYNHFFTPLANHACESVNLYQLDGKNNTSMTGTGYRLIARLGDQTAALSTAVAEMSNVDSTFVGFGITDVYHKYEINNDLFPNGITDVKFLVKGAALYDPRKDSTQGGSGAHRHNDPTTWEWSDNNALINFDWKRFYGDIELDIELFDLNNIAGEANLCDELVNYTDKNGNPAQQKRYLCNGVVDLSVKPKTVQESLLLSCAGQWIFSGGKYYLAVGAYRGPATNTITEADIKGDVKRNASTALEDRCNAVTSTFISKALYFQKTDSTPVISHFYRYGSGAPGDKGRDKGRYLEADRSFNFVQADTYCQRLNRLYMEYVAAGDTLELSVGVKGLKCAKGTTVNVHLPDSYITNKEYEVLENNYDIERQAWQLVLKETAATIYDDSITPAETDLTPNTDIDNTKVSPATGVTYTATPNDSFRQGYLAWSHPTPNSVVKYRLLVVSEPTGTYSQYFYPTAEYQDINGLDIGNYEAYIEAENRFGRYSFQIVAPFSVAVPVTPSATPIAVDIGDGYITITPVAPPNINAIYEGLWTTNSVLNPNVDAASLFKVIEAGKSLSILGVIDGQTYYLWYRLKTAEGAGLYIVRAYVGKGLDVTQVNDGFLSELSTLFEQNESDNLYDENIRNILEEDIKSVVSRNNLANHDAVADAETDVLQIELANPYTGTSAMSQFIRGVNNSLNNTTNSLTAIINKVNHATTGLQATATIATSASAAANGEAGSAVALISTKVTTLEEEADASLLLYSEIDAELDILRAVAVLKVDAAGNMAQVRLDASPLSSTVKIQADVFQFVNSLGVAKLKLNGNGNLLLDGDIIAQSLTLAGRLLAQAGDAKFDFNPATNTCEIVTTSMIMKGGNGGTFEVTENNQGSTAFIFADSTGFTRVYIPEKGGIISQPPTGYINADFDARGGSTYGLYVWGNRGVFAGGGILPFTGRHLGLNHSADVWEVGDLLCRLKVLAKPDVNNSISLLIPSSQHKQKTCYGVASEKKTITEHMAIGNGLPIGLTLTQLASDPDLSYDHLITTINSVGEGLINVCGRGGNIQNGDNLCSSSMPGKAELQGDDLLYNYTVAESHEDVVFDTPDQVKQIACTYRF